MFKYNVGDKILCTHGETFLMNECRVSSRFIRDSKNYYNVSVYSDDGMCITTIEECEDNYDALVNYYKI